MKKRAIRMCKDYNEFKAFVDCSHLKPVNRTDMDALFVNRNGGQQMKQVNMNMGYKEIDSILAKLSLGKDTASMSLPVKSKKNTSVPSTSVDLEKEWTLYCTDIDSTLRYLLLSTDKSPSDQGSSVDGIEIPKRLRVSPFDFQRLCRNEVTPYMLGGIITALHYFTKLENIHSPVECVADFISNWLVSISKCGRYELSLNFLNHEEMSSLQSLVKYLDDCDKIDSSISHMVSIISNK